MRREEVVALYRVFEADAIRLWLMGGWGVDALLGRQTREHKDLDVLVEVASLERFRVRLDSVGFRMLYIWEDEARWVHDDRWATADQQPTAFVYGAADGREVDAHVVAVRDDGTVSTLWTSPYAVTTEGLTGRGSIAGHPVRCLSREMQSIAHTGYELPPHHATDMRLLSRSR